jgi:hypothetical protein
MTTCSDTDLRHRPQCRSHARASQARVARSHILFLLVQGAAVVGGVLLGLPAAAVVGVVLGITLLAAVAARRMLGSLLAGAGIRVAQPYEPGEQIRVFVPSLDSVQDAEIVRVGPANTVLLTEQGIVLVPNAHMLRGAARTS